ncbi:MAG: ABC transporter ATP-binding protein [Cellulomonadaceae bacterium]|nr:ABC transporter ATP-binding protein [Cellulomonadaceae bacterium]
MSARGGGHAPDLHADLQITRERSMLDLQLHVEPGTVLALLGPNGAGKTTTLDALAGLLPLSAGHIRLGDRTLDEPATGRFVASEHRDVGVVFQDYLLFPHLSVVDNVAFGLRARGAGRRPARAAAAAWVERVGLDGFGDARPGALSGGQAQRVALARALATDPTLLLLDEPLAALDAATRLHVRSDLSRHLAAFAGVTVLVTHDPIDAMVLADTLVVLEDGRAVQAGTPLEVARAPRTEYVARLVGLNLYRGRGDGTAVDLDGGGRIASATRNEGTVFVAFPPSAVALHRHRPDGSPRNVMEGRVVAIEQHGEVVRVRLDGTPGVQADVTAAAVAELRLRAGDTVWAAVKATEVRTYPV